MKRLLIFKFQMHLTFKMCFFRSQPLSMNIFYNYVKLIEFISFGRHMQFSIISKRNNYNLKNLCFSCSRGVNHILNDSGNLITKREFPKKIQLKLKGVEKYIIYT